ncbi:MAG TPA: fatty acid oxidation complex subunit alpha FadJ [Polyangiales bacterium]|nr:fatty acid oxidation complex subunit alpha FadJ [Polyangiales bacterium]
MAHEGLTIEKRGDGVAIVRMDIPGEPMNTLKSDFVDTFMQAFDSVENDPEIKAIVFTSGKKDSFIAGADISMLETVNTAEEGERISREGHKAMNRIESCPKPVVAAIHGVALGGGLEVALACHARVASNSKKTKLGLPESQLGLLPGAGGTQRLPRLIGVQPALDMMLTGKQIEAKKALKMGLVDDVVPPSILIETAAELALSRIGREPKKDSFIEQLLDKEAVTEFALAKNPVGRKILFDQARKQLHKQTRGNYPAQDLIIDVVKTGLEDGFQAGLDAEARGFGRLLTTPEAANLMSIFFATTALKKDTGVDDPNVKPREIHKVGMLGAGLMGAGIAYVTTAVAKVPVRLKDRDADGVLSGLRYVRGIIDGRVKRKKLSEQEADTLMLQTTGTTTYKGFHDTDVVIEAVFEDLGLKQQMVRDIEEVGRNDVIFASNTSSLPISKIAEASKHPETVIGMHYFSPVHKMPLLEIIVTDQTADWVTATCVDLGKRQGKHVIVVKDGVGFYTSRVLAPMMNEAAHLVSEGVPIEKIDSAMLNWGFPVGPIKLTDEVGIDVGAKVGKIMHDAFGERMQPPGEMQKLIDDERYGRKNGRGFYLYGDKKKGVDESVYEVLGVSPTNKSVSNEDITWRCALQFANEACRCFGDGILRSARDGDIGAVFGLGFPPFRGGPFRFVDQVGAKEVLGRLRELEKRLGSRFSPAPVLEEIARTGQTFHGDNAVQPGRSRGNSAHSAPQASV